VDEIIIIGREANVIEQFESNMSNSFDMVDLGLLHYCLSVKVWQIGSIIFSSQIKYARSLLDRFIMTDCKILSTPMDKGLKLFAKTDSKAVTESFYWK
jgi:hypothetical protein